MVAIFVLSSIPGKGSGKAVQFIVDLAPQLQNLLHIPLFALLQFLWLRALAAQGARGAGLFASSLLITVGYGLLDEFHQSFVPGRYASLTDLLLNLTGALVGVLVYRLARQHTALE